jgi:AcrR family transcriptional regulator
MKDEKIDRRIRKTKKALLQSLIELISKKKLSSITVKELTDLADVNRSTFYLYYRDIFDMVEQIEDEMFGEFNKIFEKLRKESNIYTKEMTTYNSLVSFFTHMFEYVKDNASMIKILLGPDGDPSFIDKFKNAILQTEPPFNESVPKVKIHYLRPFIISGCVGVIQQWVMDDLKVSPKEMAVIVAEMITKSGESF